MKAYPLLQTWATLLTQNYLPVGTPSLCCPLACPTLGEGEVVLGKLTLFEPFGPEVPVIEFRVLPLPALTLFVLPVLLLVLVLPLPTPEGS